MAVTMALLPAYAEGPTTNWMHGSELKSAFAGTTIEGTYADGRPFEESYFDSGRLKYVEAMRNRVQHGNWSIVSGTFCTIYDIRPTGGCFRVRRQSANCYEFYFQARTKKEARNPGPGRPTWTARGWRKGEPSTCNERPAV